MEVVPPQYQAYADNPQAYKDGLSPAVLEGNAGRDTHDRVRSRTKEEREEEKADVKRSMDKTMDEARKGGVVGKRAAAAVMSTIEGASGENGIHQNFPVTRLDSGAGGGIGTGLDGARTIKVFLCDAGETVEQAFFVP